MRRILKKSDSREDKNMATGKTAKANLITAQLAMLSAVIIVMTFVPYLGYISYGGLSITLIHIPVIIGACILGVKGGTVLGSVWGISCLIKAVLAPPTPLEGIIFKNPLIALIPRIIAGAAAGLVYSLLSKKLDRKSVPSAVSALTACICNTALVMGGIYLFYGEKYGAQLGISSVSFGGLTNYIIAAFGINALLEIAVGIAVSVPVSAALRKIRYK